MIPIFIIWKVLHTHTRALQIMSFPIYFPFRNCVFCVLRLNAPERSLGMVVVYFISGCECELQNIIHVICINSYDFQLEVENMEESANGVPLMRISRWVGPSFQSRISSVISERHTYALPTLLHDTTRIVWAPDRFSTL